MSLPSLRLRPRTEADDPFLRDVYSSCRAAEMAIVSWSAEQKAAFLRMQYDAQRAHYDKLYPDASYLVIERDGVPVGRLYIARDPDVIRLMDIALIEDARGAGIGTRLLNDVLAEATGSGRGVVLYVERNNPAMQWYSRLGFEGIGESGIYVQMRWMPPLCERPVRIS
jgi:ribosomal protein S18 acetylase RimI-like enzyme